MARNRNFRGNRRPAQQRQERSQQRQARPVAQRQARPAAPRQERTVRPRAERPQRQKAQQLLNRFVTRGPGNKVTKKETRKIAEKTGLDPKKIAQFARNSGINIAQFGGRGGNKKGRGQDEQLPEDIFSGGGTSEVFQDEGTGIFGPIAAHEKEIAGIYADADKYIADAEVRGLDISSARQLEGLKYGADKESEWRQAVANIEVKGRLDLQPIINAGLEKVADIEAQAQRDVAETTGKYGVEGIRVRGEADKEIGKMQLAGGMYNLLNAAFG
jgi:hypothetical protein